MLEVAEVDDVVLPREAAALADDHARIAVDVGCRAAEDRAEKPAFLLLDGIPAESDADARERLTVRLLQVYLLSFLQIHAHMPASLISPCDKSLSCGAAALRAPLHENNFPYLKEFALPPPFPFMALMKISFIHPSPSVEAKRLPAAKSCTLSPCCPAPSADPSDRLCPCSCVR